MNYYKNGFECDFISGDSCIQVCHTLNDGNRRREINGLKEAKKKFGCKRAVILTYAQDEEITDEIKIEVLPVWKWLLENDALQET